jgi:signal transduction histidine kinase
MRVSQVISNLLSNAVKFTKQGTIYINSDSKDGQAIVSITDTGSGIDPEILPRLFTKFTNKSQTGTGLGLFISKYRGGSWRQNLG